MQFKLEKPLGIKPNNSCNQHILVAMQKPKFLYMFSNRTEYCITM